MLLLYGQNSAIWMDYRLHLGIVSSSVKKFLILSP